MPFADYGSSEPMEVCRGVYSMLRALSGNEEPTVSFVIKRIQVFVSMGLWMLHKQTLLSASQVEALLHEMLDLEGEEATVSENNFVGGCLIQSITPSSLNMQRFIAVLLKQAGGNLARIWEGEMPEFC